MATSSILLPREKIQSQTIRALSDHELIQAIIGNGSKSYPVKRLARSVVRLLRQSQGMVEFKDLMKVSGLGTAKASRLAAAFEFAYRLRKQRVDVSQLIDTTLRDVTNLGVTLALVSLDGAKRVINSQIISVTYPLTPPAVHASCRWLVIDNAAYVSLGIKTDDDVCATEIAREMYRSFQSIGVQLLDARMVDEVGRSLYEEYAG